MYFFANVFLLNSEFLFYNRMILFELIRSKVFLVFVVSQTTSMTSGRIFVCLCLFVHPSSTAFWAPDSIGVKLAVSSLKVEMSLKSTASVLFIFPPFPVLSDLDNRHCCCFYWWLSNFLSVRWTNVNNSLPKFNHVSPIRNHLYHTCKTIVFKHACGEKTSLQVKWLMISHSVHACQTAFVFSSVQIPGKLSKCR